MNEKLQVLADRLSGEADLSEARGDINQAARLRALVPEWDRVNNPVVDHTRKCCYNYSGYCCCGAL